MSSNVHYNLVFDIDHMLAFHMVGDIHQANFISHKGAILSETDLKTHYIYPGVLELIRLAYDTEDFKVSFFSKGSERRNRRFVQLLLDKALPDPKYDEKKLKTRIFSRDDLTKTSRGTKKDLSIVLEDDDALEDALLVDDKPRNSMAGQESNFLQVPLVDWEEYDALIERHPNYESNGTRFLKCKLNVGGFTDREKNAVQEGRRIFINKNGEDFEIKYVDRNNVVQAKTVQDPELLAELAQQYQKGIEDRTSLVSIQNRETILKICQFVTSFQGRTRKICRSANRICYVTGLLFEALSYAQANETSLSYALFTKQFKEENGYKLNLKDDQLYLEGFRRLKEVNPNFQLVTPANYNELINRDIPEEDRLFLQAALDNELS